MQLLRNPVREYAWGSRRCIAEMQGRATPSPVPEAELWLGAHPTDSSVLIDDEGLETPLALALRNSSREMMGALSANRWRGTLPFMMKMLAAEAPLSLQVHPSEADAADGYAREEHLGIEIASPSRNYKDRLHKPELACAVTDFHALSGFREIYDTVRLLSLFSHPALDFVSETIRRRPDATGARSATQVFYSLPTEALRDLIEETASESRRLLSGVATEPESRQVAEFQLELETVVALSARYPSDPAVLISLLLNRVRLTPGEALFQAPGVPHAYLSGVCIEVMSNSDNVVRGGLTKKNIDVGELLRTTDFRPAPPCVIQGETLGRATRYDAGVDEFSLHRLDLDLDDGPVVLPGVGPRIVLCRTGLVQFNSDRARIDLRGGDSAWLDAHETRVSVSARSDSVNLYLASIGRSLME
jgi:mannose-6-phosphate isomerase